jgi:hypothetical protein
LAGTALARALRTILLAGLIAGVLDISYVFIYYHQADPFAILRGIATGLLGPGAREGGLGTAALGLACHFVIALGAAAVFYAASRRLAALRRRPWLVGPLYGVAVWLFMNLVVLPLDANPPKNFPASNWPVILIAHLGCVGLPIALMVSRSSKAPAP